MKKLTIRDLPVNEINAAKYNPRDITEEAFEGLKESVRKFGIPVPLVVNKTTGNLVSGHQRLKAAIYLGWKTVPVVEVSLTEVEEKALNVTLNNNKITGHFTDALQGLLEEIKVEFSDEEFASLRFDDLVIPSEWDTGTEQVDSTEENLDGLTATFKVKCPQDIKDEVLIILKRAFLETSLEGVEIV